jgi:hypothetical protein
LEIGRRIVGSVGGLGVKQRKLIDVNFGDVTGLILLVLILTGADLAFHVHPAAFVEIFHDDLPVEAIVPTHYVMPLGVIDALAFAVAVRVGGSQGESSFRALVFELTDFGVFAKIPDQNYFVDALHRFNKQKKSERGDFWPLMEKQAEILIACANFFLKTAIPARKGYLFFADWA